jgi:hypothetical protein
MNLSAKSKHAFLRLFRPVLPFRFGLLINPAFKQVTICLLQLCQINLPPRPSLSAMVLVVQNASALILLRFASAFCHLFECRVNKSPFCRHFSSRFLACPFGHGLVCTARTSLLVLRTGVKIIDFLWHSSFAIASS